MDRVGGSKWVEYVFEDVMEVSETEIDTNQGQYTDEHNSEFVYGEDCIIDEKDVNLKHWVPRCPIGMKHVVGMTFESIEAGGSFYRAYASTVGFYVKKSTQSTFRWSDVVSRKYFRCNKEGFKNIGNSTGQRQTKSDRVGCNAKIVLKYRNGLYAIDTFVEEHTHKMIPSNGKHLLKSNRKMEIGHKKFILSCAKANLGPIGSHKLLEQLVGGFSNMCATARDFRNYKRDLMINISEADAQMAVNKLQNNKEMCSSFYFEYTVNESNELTKMFWSDPIWCRNYAAYGSNVSFDATYGTNRYNMVFAPFTGLDNHRRCVTFGCGLLVKEDAESYIWLFQQFKKAMCSEPTVLVTDQDCAMKIAVERVFEKTRHRLCMWHIMDKVPSKVSPSKINEPGFRKTLGQLVWRDQLTTCEFEGGWQTFITDHELSENRWFQDMYVIRANWILSFFRDIVMGDLIRTTSISESQNSFFGKYSNKSFSLVELLTHYDTALGKQRYNQLCHDIDSDSKSYELKTPLAIEKNTSEVYTLNIFSQVQEEINDACFYCCVTNESTGTEFIEYTIKEGRDDIFEIRYRVEDGFSTCTCMMFMRIGLPCCHLFTAWKANGCQKIPDCMILPRWKKGASRNINMSELNDVFKHSAGMEGRQTKLSAVWSDIYASVGLAQDDESKLDILQDDLKKLKTVLEQHLDDGENTNRTDVEEFLGINVPEEVVVHPPEKAKNKGRVAKRIKGGKEKSMADQEKAAKKGKRKCKNCGQCTGHDSRNCKEAPRKV